MDGAGEIAPRNTGCGSRLCRENDKIITRNHSASFLDRLYDAIITKRPHLGKKKVPETNLRFLLPSVRLT